MSWHIPLIGRLSGREYSAVVLGTLFLALETLLHIVILFLPQSVISWFYERTRTLFHRFSSPPRPKSPEKVMSDRVRKARDFTALCEIFGYTSEEHVILTKDGYLLTLHRLPTKKNQSKTAPGTSTGKPCVYLHHGLLMNSEVWLCLTDEQRCLPFVLAEQGFDVWLGNNRGNKYSKKSIHHSPNSTKFWDFSMDDFAWHDIPDSIEYILETTQMPSIGYVGFSQGTAQAFAALSIHPKLNQKVNVFIALAPAMSPTGLSAPIVDALMKASPTLVFLLFGRRSILSSTAMWQSIVYPPIFTAIIDTSLNFLFAWRSLNIDMNQKLAAYSHLYSFTSVKAVVHWFQIMRNGVFQMYDDDVSIPVALALSSSGEGVTSYRPARFPTRNIVTPIVLLYGDKDSLVDINVMLHELPDHTAARRLAGYEHLDVLWGRDVHRDVIPHVVDSLKEYVSLPPPRRRLTNGTRHHDDVVGLSSDS